MSRPPLAIATCRVSSVEQLESNSLNRQLESVRKAADSLGAIIPSDGVWSGSISSKSGSNYSRKDLNEMLAYCKKHPTVKYLIVDEIDRFMRSIDEMFYFEVLFNKGAGVKVWYAQDANLNSDDPFNKLRRAMEAFKAEGSNLERQVKSVKGLTSALKDGRYPFVPKPGYRRGYERGIHEIHPKNGPIIKNILSRIAAELVTPSQALVELNASDFTKGRSKYRMDKFRRIVTDPYYAGIVEMDRQVQYRNENGLHESLITKDQHKRLVWIMQGKPKNQTGPKPEGNPEYPCNNIVVCEPCEGKPNCRVVGFEHGNGKPNSTLRYKRYRCRSCGRYINQDVMHQAIKRLFSKYHLTENAIEDFVWATESVWREETDQAEQEINRLADRVKELKAAISEQVEATSDPANVIIKEDLLAAIVKKKSELTMLEVKLEKLTSSANEDKGRFLRFALDFINNMGSHFLELSFENRLRCKQLLFPGGFYWTQNDAVLTREVSPIYRLLKSKKARTDSVQALMVRHEGKNSNLTGVEFVRWCEILYTPYRHHLHNDHSPRDSKKEPVLEHEPLVTG